MNQNSYLWKKLKVTANFRWYAASRVYRWEGGSHLKILQTMGGLKKDADIMASIDLIQRTMYFTWWVCKEGSYLFILEVAERVLL